MKKLILFELRKVFSKRLALIALIGIILFSALLSFSTFQNKYTFDPNIGEGTGKTAVEIDKEIAAKYEGILTDEKVHQMMSDFAPTSDLHGLSAIYVYQNAMQSAAFSRFSDKEGNWNGLSVSDVFGNEEIKIGYVDGWLSTSRNMVRVFVALALAVIIMLAPIFSSEYNKLCYLKILYNLPFARSLCWQQTKFYRSRRKINGIRNNFCSHVCFGYYFGNDWCDVFGKAYCFQYRENV